MLNSDIFLAEMWNRYRTNSKTVLYSLSFNRGEFRGGTASFPPPARSIPSVPYRGHGSKNSRPNGRPGIARLNNVVTKLKYMTLYGRAAAAEAPFVVAAAAPGGVPGESEGNEPVAAATAALTSWREGDLPGRYPQPVEGRQRIRRGRIATPKTYVKKSLLNCCADGGRRVPGTESAPPTCGSAAPPDSNRRSK